MLAAVPDAVTVGFGARNSLRRLSTRAAAIDVASRPFTSSDAMLRFRPPELAEESAAVVNCTRLRRPAEIPDSKLPSLVVDTSDDVDAADEEILEFTND